MANTSAKDAQAAFETAFEEQDYRIIMGLMSRFPHYSYRNILILKKHCPNAQFPLRRFSTWLKFGRVVAKDQTAIPICTYYGEDEDDGDKANAEGAKPARQRRGRKKKKEKASKAYSTDFGYQPLFDISQTVELEEFEGVPMQYTPLASPKPQQNVVAFNQDVPQFMELMTVLQSVSPLPISFSTEIEPDGMLTYSEIIVRAGITQLRAVRATLSQMVHALIHANCRDQERKAIEADSVVYVVSQRIGLETAGLRLQQITDFGADRESKEKKAFLATVQKTAMFLVDSIEGEQEALRLGFDTNEVCLLLEQKTAKRVLRQGNSIWLVNPEDLSLSPAANEKEIEKHKGPFAVGRAAWFNTAQPAA